MPVALRAVQGTLPLVEALLLQRPAASARRATEAMQVAIRTMLDVPHVPWATTRPLLEMQRALLVTRVTLQLMQARLIGAAALSVRRALEVA